MIFHELLPKYLTFMTNVFGSYVTKKYFGYGTNQQREMLSNHIISYGWPIIPCV
jgi:hypothetical protein